MVALNRASSGLTDEPMQQLLGRIGARLAMYIGLIEIARTNNREGNPVGSVYLAEASGIMQQTILPDAQKLYEEISGRLDAQITASARIPATVFLIVFVTLLCGVYSTRWWARRAIGRRLNIGFVAGGLAVLIMMVWVGTALAICIAYSRSAKSPGDSLKTITELAISAQQARADETLALIVPGDEHLRNQSYDARIDGMHKALTVYLASSDAIAKTDLQKADPLLNLWRPAHDRIISYGAKGNFRAAIQVVLGRGNGDSTPVFNDLTQALDNGIDESRRQLHHNTINALGGLSGATVGTVVLSVVAAVAVIAGLWPKMKDER
jgi:hypothetical protein